MGLVQRVRDGHAFSLLPDSVDFTELRHRSPGVDIANPDLVNRIRTGAPLAEAPK